MNDGEQQRKLGAEKERLSELMRKSVEKTAMALSTDQNKEYIQFLLIDPFLKHILSRLFPYILIGISIFATLFLFIVLSIVFLIFEMRRWNGGVESKLSVSCPFCFRADV